MGGEFQIYTPNNAVQRANLVTNLFRAWSSNIQTYGTGTSVDISPFVALGGNPTAMVDALDLTLTHGNMPAAAKSIIVTAVTGETGGNLRRAQRGCYLFLTSAYYNVWH
jgi:tetrahydromethanopterin S-methyltransferase subunit C